MRKFVLTHNIRNFYQNASSTNLEIGFWKLEIPNACASKPKPEKRMTAVELADVTTLIRHFYLSYI